MRRAAHFASLLLFGAISVGAEKEGCDPNPYRNDCQNKGVVCDGNGGGGGEGGSGGAGGSGGNVPIPGCIPRDSAVPVGDECGVFVSASMGTAMGDGTTGRPLQSLKEAVTLALMNERGKRQVYACAETFTEVVHVPAGVTIYGGLDCTGGWAFVGSDPAKKTVLTAGEGEIPLTISGVGPVQIVDLHIKAFSFNQEETAARSMSSIAVIAEAATVAFAHSTLEAGDAAPGAVGAPYVVQRAPDGATGAPGNVACSANTVLGAEANVNACETPGDESDDSVGGSGGIGSATSGGPGSTGQPGTAMNGGPGQASGTVLCAPGAQGSDGADGSPGAGAPGIGTLTVNGYSDAAGADGMRGATAQGGGGGGGSRGGTSRCPVVTPTRTGGASGGSGGSGGCGGAGGRGGGFGGSSIALVSRGAALSFEDVVLKAGHGGKGGDGGLGQLGGNGAGGSAGGSLQTGAPADQYPGCSGGAGGRGGTGGKGGGGRGGHSLGIAYVGDDAPTTDGATITPGIAGLGGAGSDAMHKGADGIQTPVQKF